MGKTQDEFAKLIGENLSNLKTYENTSVKPKVHIRKRIAAMAGVSVADLLHKDLTEDDIHLMGEKDEKDKRHENAPSNSLQPDSATQTPEVRNYASLMEERLKELKEDKEWLKRNFEFSLTGLVVGQRSILAHVETILEKDNERDAAGNTMKEKDLKDDVNRRIAEKMVVGAKKDIQANTG